MADESKKNIILSSAGIVFQKKRFNKATMQEIASNARVNIGTLYRFFSSKEDLYAAVMKDVLNEIGQEISLISGTNHHPLNKLEGICEVFMKTYERNAQPLINLFHLQSAEILETISAPALAELNARSKILKKRILDVINEGIEQEVFINEKPNILGDILWGTYTGVVLWVDSKRFLNHQKKFVPSTLKAAFKLLIKGMTKSTC